MAPLAPLPNPAKIAGILRLIVRDAAVDHDALGDLEVVFCYQGLFTRAVGTSRSKRWRVVAYLYLHAAEPVFYVVKGDLQGPAAPWGLPEPLGLAGS